MGVAQPFVSEMEVTIKKIHRNGDVIRLEIERQPNTIPFVHGLTNKPLRVKQGLVSHQLKEEDVIRVSLQPLKEVEKDQLFEVSSETQIIGIFR
jgi:hypothetical protein